MSERVRRSRRSRDRRTTRPERSTEHLRHLNNPFHRDELLSADEVAHIHSEALRFLEEHGLRILLAEARGLLLGAGAEAGSEDTMIRIPQGLTTQSLGTAPSTFTISAPHASRDLDIGGSNVALLPVGGPPFVSSLDDGRRPGTLADFENFCRLTQTFDVLHANAPTVEPQDVAMNDRHLVSLRTQLRLTDKVPFIFCRGRERVVDLFEMLRISAGLDHETFRQTPLCWANVNTNSPRQIDVPMAMGIIDFARAGQPCIMTPFTLAGAMAPVSMAGALLLQHIEVLAAVVVSQVARAGAPVMYGGFTSNVDMKSGSPAFGTPEAMRGAVATGQLARHVGLPWRSSGSSSSPTEDAQGSYETLFNLMGALRGGANLVLHAAGWQEGGLCASYEKFVLDIEILQTIAESWRAIDMAETELAYDTLAEVPPGGHFFGAAHTLERFEQAFYEPLVSTRQNFEQWVEDGRQDARTRANRVWKEQLARYEAPARDDAVTAELDEFAARRIAEGGAKVD